MNIKRLAVYCGSAPGSDPRFTEAARQMGEAIVERGLELVYGGGRLGLMGIVADTVINAGGVAYGVIPRALVDKEVAHAGLTDLYTVTTMHERKAMMTELCDAFVCLPGGIGTLDEMFEAWTWNALARMGVTPRNRSSSKKVSRRTSTFTRRGDQFSRTPLIATIECVCGS